eukprot:185930_1
MVKMQRELRRLQQRGATNGTAANVFWTKLGDVINSDPKIMTFIKEMMVNGTQDDENKIDRTLIQKVVETMGVTNDLEIKCEYLFSKMETHISPILHKEVFWQQSGFDIRDHQKANEMIQQHPKLLNKIESMSKHQKTHLVRLVDELGIRQIIAHDNQLQIYYLLCLLQTEGERIGNKNSFW